MSDYIDRQAAIDAVAKGCQEWRGIFERCEKNILALPTIDADIKCADCKAIIALKAALEPVKRGTWIYDNQFHWYRASCSECGYMRGTDIKADKWNDWKYCPMCGARMSEGSEEC